MKYSEVASNVSELVSSAVNEDHFVFDFLLAYGSPKATIARLKSGQVNMAKAEGEVLLKKKFWFKPVEDDLFKAMESLKADKALKSNDPRFLFVTDFKQVLAFDRKTEDSLDIELEELDSNFDFFLPLAGMEKTKLSNENPADVKAAEKMAKLFDAIKKDNIEFVTENSHAMNVFLSRLLFCLFAEDTGIFQENSVCNSIASHTAEDGSDVNQFFIRLFDLLDTEDRNGLPQHLAEMPYVNGGLFKDHYPVPVFSRKTRRMIIESGSLNWAEINPDIFGSMFQAVIHPEERHNLGQHYTSVTNIMKVIEPLFLNDFKECLEKAKNLQKGKKQALQSLLDRIAKVKLFDPACGSGNFLIIAYKELRLLEMEVFKEFQTIEGIFPLSGMKVSQFYGIEIADFAAETAILALWLVEHQMNLEYKKLFGQPVVSLPLKEGAHIICGNACRLDWEEVCPKEKDDEIYILGNPPYLGARMQSKEQKGDLADVFKRKKGVSNLDYIACWFQLATQYVRGTSSIFAFVSTNSISQGEQVAILWPNLLGGDLEIAFAHQSFKWENNAKGSAGVTCVIIGVRNKSFKTKNLFHGMHASRVYNINAYLVNAGDTFVSRRGSSISKLPKMPKGNMPYDGGHLILSKREREALLFAYPEADKFIKILLGSKEFIQGTNRWCLWINDENFKDAIEIPELKNRIDNVRKIRLESTDKGANKLASRPHQFREVLETKNSSIIIPSVSSERREYIPVGFITSDTIVSNLAFVVYDAEPWIFGLITSRMHMTWVRTTCGRLETRIRYSSALCYNTFPVPDLNETQKEKITTHVIDVIEARENHSEKTMAQLYDPDKMPEDLREAHHQLDLCIDQIYRKKPFESDEERLEHLFKLYEEMIAKEKKG